MKNFFARSAVVATAVVSSAAFADVATTVTEMQTEMTTNLSLVGTALVALAAVAVGFKWIKGMIFS